MNCPARTRFLVNFLAFLSYNTHPHKSNEQYSTERASYLGVSQQLHNPTLVRRESNDLPNDRADELGPRGLNTLALTRADGFGNGSRRVTLVESTSKICERTPNT